MSLAEDLDAIAALRRCDWGERSTVRDAYAATLVKRQSQRPTFDVLFDLYFPGLVGSGVAAEEDTGGETVRDGADALRGFRDELLEASVTATTRSCNGSPSRRSDASGRCPAGVRG